MTGVSVWGQITRMYGLACISVSLVYAIWPLMSQACSPCMSSGLLVFTTIGCAGSRLKRKAVGVPSEEVPGQSTSRQRMEAALKSIPQVPSPLPFKLAGVQSYD